MTFRTKLMLAMAPLVLALASVGVVSGLVASILARQPAHIWQDNYRSVLAAERMKESIERIQEAALLDLLQASATPGRESKSVADFERELKVEIENITEPGETEAAARLQASWRDYLATLAAFHTDGDQARRRAICLGPLRQAFWAVKRATGEILDINQDAVVRKGRHTERRAAFFERVLTLAVVLASVVGLLASVSLTTRLLRPLGVVSAAVRRFGEGDTRARAQVQGEDDIALLAQEFNTMADHLERYRRSTLGELLQAQQAAQAAIDSLPDPVVMMDTSGKIDGINLAGRRILNIDPEEKGRVLRDEVDPAVRSLMDRVRVHVVGGHGGFSPKGFEDALRLKADGGERFFLPRASPIYGEYGSVSGVALVLQDVTRLFQFDELKNNLVATVAHEFRTPLTSLRMAIHLCTEQTVGPLTDKQADLLFAARDDCERLQGIVDDLLNLSRLESGRIELQKRRISARTLVDLAKDVHAAAAQARQIALQTEVYPGLPDIFADADRLQLVFANLLTNAIRYAPAGSGIVIRAIPGEPSRDVSGEGKEARAYVRFEIVDQGPGIASEHQSALFEKFFRVPGSAEGGSGLGLFIARGIVQAHGGRIGVFSEKDKGATFWFTVPAAPELPASSG